MKKFLYWVLNLYQPATLWELFRKEFWLCLFGGMFFVWFIITSEKYENPNVGLYTDDWLVSLLISLGSAVSILLILSVFLLVVGYIYGLVKRNK